MLRKSVSKILSSSLQCGRRRFSSKKPLEPQKEWWNEPLDDCIPCNESKISSKTLQLPVSAGQSPKIVSVVDSSKESGMSYASYNTTPCHEKKFSPCAEKVKPEQEPTKVEPIDECHGQTEQNPTTADCKDHKTLIPPSNILQRLKSYEIKSNCTSFKINSCN